MPWLPQGDCCIQGEWMRAPILIDASTSTEASCVDASTSTEGTLLSQPVCEGATQQAEVSSAVAKVFVTDFCLQAKHSMLPEPENPEVTIVETTLTCKERRRLKRAAEARSLDNSSTVPSL